MPISKPADLKIKQFMAVLLYGQPGVWKTTLALSAPDPVLLDFDGGVHRVRPEHQVDTLQINSWDDVLTELEAGSFNKYKTLVIDTAGRAVDYLSAYVIANNPKLGDKNGVLSLKGYGERKALFSAFKKRLEMLGKNVIFVAHEDETKEGDGKYIRPEVGGSSGKDLFKDLDLIGYMEVIGKRCTVSFLPTEKYYAKNSCGLNEIIAIPPLASGAANNFMATHIMATFFNAQKDRRGLVQEYENLMAVVDAKVEAITNPEEANEVVEWAKEYKQHIWGSKFIASQKINEQCKSRGLRLNKSTGKYEVVEIVTPEMIDNLKEVEGNKVQIDHNPVNGNPDASQVAPVDVVKAENGSVHNPANPEPEPSDINAAVNKAVEQEGNADHVAEAVKPKKDPVADAKAFVDKVNKGKTKKDESGVNESKTEPAHEQAKV